MCGSPGITSAPWKQPLSKDLQDLLISFFKEYLKSINFIYTLKYFIFNKYVSYKDKNDNSQDPIPMMNMTFHELEFTILNSWKCLLLSHC